MVTKSHCRFVFRLKRFAAQLTHATCTVSNPQSILREHNLQALKRFGQNFVINPAVFDKVIAALPEDARVLEIGPGLGALTRRLLDSQKLDCVNEIDRGLIEILSRQFPGLKIIQGDFLEQDSRQLSQNNFNCVVGNLPFYITTDILLKIIRELPQVETAILGVQWEFAQRAAAATGSSLALFLQAAGDVTLLGKTDRKSFYPAPEVDAGWLLYRRAPKVRDLAVFEILTRGLFWGKRKNIGNTIRKNPHFAMHEVSKDWASTDLSSLAEITALRPDALNWELVYKLFCTLYPAEVTK